MSRKQKENITIDSLEWRKWKDGWQEVLTRKENKTKTETAIDGIKIVKVTSDICLAVEELYDLYIHLWIIHTPGISNSNYILNRNTYSYARRRIQ